MTVDKNIHDYMFERYESYVDYINKEEKYEYIYTSLSTEDLLLDECRDFLESHISEEMLVDIVLRTIDITHLLGMLRDYFDWYSIIHCDECDVYWMDDEDDEEHECAEDDDAVSYLVLAVFLP